MPRQIRPESDSDAAGFHLRSGRRMNRERLHTLREIDTAVGAAKGAAFRAFKRRLPELVEGRDFRHLEHHRDAGEIEALRKAGRLYRASVNVVLLTERGRAVIQADLVARCSR